MLHGRRILLTLSTVAALSARISHALPLNLEGAPLEVRIRNASARQVLNKAWSGALPLGGGMGEIQGAGWQAALGAVSMNPQGFQLEGSSAILKVDHWKFQSDLFKKGFGMDAECSNLRVSFLPGTVNIPFPKDLDIAIKTGNGKLELNPTWDSRAWVDSFLRPYFAPETLDRVLKVEGSCNGGLQDLADKLIRARLKDMPSKDPQFYTRITNDLAREAQASIERSLRGALPTVPAGLDFNSALSFRVEGDTLVIKPVGQDTDFLTAESRAMVREMAAGNAPHALAVFSTPALNRAILIGMTGAAAHNGGVITEDRIEYTLPETYKTKNFASAIGEFSGSDPEQPLKIRLAMPAQGKNRPNPELRPWISSTGLASGADLRWSLTIDFLSAANDALLATRTIAVEFVFTDTHTEDGRNSFKYESGRWLPEESVVGNAAPELGITLDWILGSEMFKGFMEKNLTEALAWKDTGRVDFKRLGQASLQNRRETGGYYAEALVIRARFR